MHHKKNIRNKKGSNPTRAQLSRKKFQIRMIKKDFVSNMKLLSYKHLVMKTLGLFFVNPCILISIISNFFQLLQLLLSCNSNSIIIHVTLFNGPKSFVFKLHWYMTCFFINHHIRWHTYRWFVSSPTSPKCITKL